MNEDLVSVIIPVYNREKSILKSIRSVLDQTYEFLECIVVDDCSTDNTKEVISRIEDTRLKYVKLEVNSGPSIARNVGIKKSEGKYIAFQDSDDEWAFNKLEKQIDIIKRDSQIGLVYCGYSYTKNGKTVKIPSDHYDISQLEGNIFETLWKGNKIGTPTILIKRECINACGGFVEKLHSLEDWEFVLRISEKYRIAYINEILVYVNYTPNSVNEQYEAQAEAIWYILNRYIEKKQQDISKIYLLFDKLTSMPYIKNQTDWESRIIPMIGSSGVAFKLIIMALEQKKKIEKVNLIFTKIADFDLLKKFIMNNIDTENEKFAIYGAGTIGIFLAQVLKMLNISFEYIIDQNDVFIQGFKIIKPSMVEDKICKIIITIADAAENKELDINLPSNIKRINIYDILITSPHKF